MKTKLYRASNLKSTITFWPLILSGSQFLAPVKNRQFLRFIHNKNNNNNYHNLQLLHTGFLRVILKRALRDLLDTNFTVIGPFGFSFSVWTKIGPCWLYN